MFFMKITDKKLEEILEQLNFQTGVTMRLNHDQILEFSIKPIYFQDTECIQRFAKLIKDEKCIRKCSTVFPYGNDMIASDKKDDLLVMLRLVQLKNIHELDVEVI